jgi:hypothetical protein
MARDVETNLVGVEGHAAEPQDMELASRMAAVLDNHYPGHAWAVHVDSEQGVANIFNWAVSFRYGYRLKLKDLLAPGKETANLRPVIMAGGEILERANMVRGAWKEGEYLVGTIDGVDPKRQKNIVGPDGEVIII